jgi:hypothetical protein
MGVKFDMTDISGHPVVVPTPIKDAMLAILRDPQATKAKKDLATDLLKWYSAQTLKPPLTGDTELDRASQLTLIEFDAGLLWKGGDRLEQPSVNRVEKPVIVHEATGEVINSYRA